MKTPFAEHVGAEIARLRRAKGLTQKELAEDAGVSPSYLGEVEGGRHQLSLIKAVNIAWALGVPLSYLLPR